MDEKGLERFAGRMREAGLPEIATREFLRAVEFVSSGGATTIPEDSIEPVDSVADLAGLAEYEEAGRDAVSKTAVIKLNGGLGTSMGLSRAKSLLPIRPGVTFLDLIARQILWQRSRWHVDLPLVLMNSYRTRADSLAALAAYPDLAKEIPLDFVQHKVPRIDAETWAPVEWPEDDSLAWCPPGHGDLYIALVSSGMLEILRSHGIRYAFVSNADNLGAVLDLRILGWVARNGIPFAMEVAERTESDRKGGHLARRDGRLMLREVAQCPEEDLESFQDVERHHFFNTNNLWLDLDALDHELGKTDAGLPLPVMRNEKRVAPRDPASPRCYQLETAMGSAIECFEGAEAILVSRERFAPVKTTNDLLTLWSDAYTLTEDERMVPVDAEANRLRLIDLDPRFYGHVEDLQSRFPEGAPSLLRCRRLVVKGDFRFGRDVSVEGCVELVNDSEVPVEVPAGALLSGALS
ncbi:MAG TPA: UTP--glucose-1-phosphate uridylyltransferase [Deltaproteobacteria bacterium]|nr:UTP--glucose-1-phosphate uridylyltransferase [Deltaproteobacteria bacterium]